jgi:hypothetical protein
MYGSVIAVAEKGRVYTVFKSQVAHNTPETTSKTLI